MITEEQLKEAYDRANALSVLDLGARDAWSKYWALVDQRREECRILRGERHPMTAVPKFEDTITALLRMFEDEDQQRAQVISTLPLITTDGADSGW